ncbi:MAG: Hpt domain-containing protein [Chloroflexaceae bacterium]|nr:Hpt domain-containing protein [Chloroflexaceae bacterium]
MLFLSDTAEKLEAMQQARTQGDAQVLMRLAHALKSNSAQFGALHLSALCRKLEMQARTGQLDCTADLLIRIDAEFARVHRAMAMEGNAREYPPEG